MIEKEVKKFIYQVIKGIGERYEFDVQRVAIDDDHVHVFMGAPPRYAPAKIAHLMKGITAREVFKQFSGKKRLLWGGEFWEDGYCVRSVGDKVTEEIVKQYIERHNKEKGHESCQLELF